MLFVDGWVRKSSLKWQTVKNSRDLKKKLGRLVNVHRRDI